jgi:cyanophycinase
MAKANGTQSHAGGAVALVGSGEYTDAMAETDRYLMATLGGSGATRIALLPTASGLEPDAPARWNALGQRHFAGLGATDIRPTDIIDAASAADSEQVALLRDANFFYLSGGDPQHVIQTLRGSPAWEAITAAYGRGAVLAGCSAGAMALSGRTLSLRQVLVGTQVEWVKSLGVVPHVIVFPHFDRMAGFMGEPRFQEMVGRVPEGHIAVGIDEDTALVRTAVALDIGDAPPARWRVMGRQTVTIFGHGAERRILRAGDEVTL